jgi:hypothetical protein
MDRRRVEKLKKAKEAKENSSQFRYLWTDPKRNTILVDPKIEKRTHGFFDPDGVFRQVPLFIIEGNTDEDAKNPGDEPLYKYKVEIPILKGPVVEGKQKWLCLSSIRENREEAVTAATEAINEQFLNGAKERNDVNYKRMFSWEETFDFVLPSAPELKSSPQSFSKLIA